MAEEPGVNLGYHQTVDDWQTVRAGGARFASVTVTESSNWSDPGAERQLAASRRAGLHTGLRHYARPGAVADQAAHAARVGAPLGAFERGALAPALHVEVDGVDDRFVKSWIKAIRQATGVRRVLVYAGYEHWLHQLHPDKWADQEVVLWLARHNGIPGRPGWFHARLGVHQHSAGGFGQDAVVYPFTLADLLL